MKAKEAKRARQHQNIHLSYDDPCQRLLNAIGVGSYIRPHRHSLDPKIETLVAVRGLFALVTFDPSGEIDGIIRFGSEKYDDILAPNVGVELHPGVWHTVAALTDGAVLLEVKAGPFNPGAAKEFAPWAPEEGTDEAVHYMQSLRLAVNNANTLA